jgi:hypothetical protein
MVPPSALNQQHGQHLPPPQAVAPRGTRAPISHPSGAHRLSDLGVSRQQEHPAAGRSAAEGDPEDSPPLPYGLRRNAPPPLQPQSTVSLSRSAASVAPPPSRWGRWPAGQRGPPDASPGAAPSADSPHRPRHRHRANPRLPHFVVETKNRPHSHPCRQRPDRMQHRPCPAFGSPRLPRPRIQPRGEETNRAPPSVATQRTEHPRKKTSNRGPLCVVASAPPRLPHCVRETKNQTPRPSPSPEPCGGRRANQPAGIFAPSMARTAARRSDAA